MEANQTNEIDEVTLFDVLQNAKTNLPGKEKDNRMTSSRYIKLQLDDQPKVSWFDQQNYLLSSRSLTYRHISHSFY